MTKIHARNLAVEILAEALDKFDLVGKKDWEDIVDRNGPVVQTLPIEDVTVAGFTVIVGGHAIRVQVTAKS